MANTEPASDPRDTFVDRFAKRTPAKVDAQVVDDLRYFAKRAAEDKEISITGLLQFFAEQRGVVLKRYRLATIARENGIEPWWSV
ncbi:MAG TPA: hypothetical protein VFM56_12645 [Solimonas sp.]|nr:hypothetical protein [Solimonas sp.]